MPIVKCTKCEKPVNRPKSWLAKIKNPFCSKSCAAQYNNRKFPKRHLEGKCRECSVPIRGRYSYCDDCISKGKHLRGKPWTLERTIESLINGRRDSNRYTAIRKHAALQTRDRPQCCAICGYDKHVETCHIVDIKDFPKTATLREVNDPRNLLLLCKNCHWELDHDLVNQETIEQIRYKI
jgi:hypothetical protein